MSSVSTAVLSGLFLAIKFNGYASKAESTITWMTTIRRRRSRLGTPSISIPIFSGLRDKDVTQLKMGSAIVADVERDDVVPPFLGGKIRGCAINGGTSLHVGVSDWLIVLTERYSQ